MSRVSPEIRLEVQGLRELQRKAIAAVRALEGPPLMEAIKRATLLVIAESKRLAPADTGILRASITPKVEVDGPKTRGIVGSNVVYAPYMELGTGTFVGKPPHFPPPSALEVWAERHGFSSGFVVALSIFKQGGLRPRKFLQRGLERNEYKIGELIKAAVKKIAQGKK